jgi:tRNA(Ile)-lysidine synthase
VILSRKIADFIRSHDLISKGDGVLVAVSGGPDSVALLHGLVELREELSLRLEVAHLQHGVRGEDAKDDAAFVAELADKLQAPFHLKEINLPAMKSTAGKGNLEALGRAERYRFFADVARERKLEKVATAHTLDDQAETVAMWFLRGAGLKGLGGMAPVQSRTIGGNAITVIRPLLEISKQELLAYLKERGLGYRRDRTNRDPALLRNWLRLDLLPKLQQRLDARLPARLAQQAEIFRDENAFLDGLARSSYEAMSQDGSLSRPGLLDTAKAVQRRVLRLWIEQARGHLRGIEFVHIEDMLRLIEEGPSQGRVSIPGGWELVREYDTVKLEKRRGSRRQVCYDYSLQVGILLRIPEAGLELHSELISALTKLPDGLMEAVFDRDRLAGRLSVRNFRRGDRFQPLGMSGHKKVKDLFIEKHIPVAQRAACPLLISGGEVLWIPGYGRSGTACLSTKTTAVLHLKVRPIPG